jgi:hypothetical protein
MPARCKGNHLQEHDRMEYPDPLAEPGAPGEFKNAKIGENSLQLKSQDLAFFVGFKRHMTIFGKLYKSAEVAAKRCAKK